MLRNWAASAAVMFRGSSAYAGTYTGLSFGYALYGTQGTLVLDLNAKKLTLTLRQEMGKLCCSTIYPVRLILA